MILLKELVSQNLSSTIYQVYGQGECLKKIVSSIGSMINISIFLPDKHFRTSCN